MAAFSAENAKVSVVVRARPAADPGVDASQTIRVYDDQPGLISIRAQDNGEPVEREFLFDDVLAPSASQKEVFERCCQKQVDHVLDGFNACLFAYGQTGSGKTYTIFGEEGEQQGIVPRSVEYLFSSIQKRPQKKYAVFASFLEVYMDRLRDLGTLPGQQQPAEGEGEYRGTQKPSSRPGTAGSRKSDKGGVNGEPEDLEIRENPNGTVYVKDLSRIAVTSVGEVMGVINHGVARRQTYHTLMNESSSRSHTIFTLTVVTEGKGADNTVTGHLNLVDLAGCERLKRSGAGDSASGVSDSGLRAKEAVIINKSLSTLGTVVMALAKNNGTYVPHRDSKLTRLLQDSLGGNSYTTLIATVHPRPEDAEEGLSSLQFANRCRNMMTQPHVNYLDADPASQQRVIDKLMTEVAELKQQLSAQKEHYEEKLSLAESQPQPSMGRTESMASAIGRSDSAVNMDKGRRVSVGGGSRRAMPGDAGKKALATTDPAAELAEARSLAAQLQEKFVKKNNEFRGAQEAARKNEDRLKKEIDDCRTKVMAATEKLASQTQSLTIDAREQAERYEKELEQLKEHNNKLLNDMDAALRSVPTKLRIHAKSMQDAEETARKVTAEKDTELVAALRKAAEDKDKALALQKEQYEYWLGKKSEELKTFIDQYERFKTDKTAQLSEVERQALYLFDYCNSLATILQNFEKGLYPVYEKSGVKAVQIPEKAKPGPMAPDVMREMIKYRKRAEDFMRAHPTAITTTLTPPASSGGGAVGGDAATYELQQQLDAIKDKLATAEAAASSKQVEERARIEQEVLNDLADHPTVEYIKRIEDERAYYKEQLAEEVRRCKDLRVTLDSKQRQIDKLGGTVGNNTTIRSANASRQVSRTSINRSPG